MSFGSKQTAIGTSQKIILLLSAILMAILLFLYRGGIISQAPLDTLARQSLEPEVALSNGRATIFEFYADWCEACREMAPSMLAVEKQTEKKIDIVLLNVDNRRWHDLLDKYEVNGIPQLNFFDANGNQSGSSIGLRSKAELITLTNSLLKEEKLNIDIQHGKVSDINAISTQINDSFSPRSHS